MPLSPTPSKATSSTPRQAGTTALEVIVCLAVMLQLLIFAASWMKRSVDHSSQALAARHINLVSMAAQYYVQDHLDDLLQAWEHSSDPVALEVSTLQTEGYLPDSFVNLNPFQQSAQVELRCLESDPENPKSPKLIQILTYTLGGQALSDTDARGVADAIGGKGGYLPQPPKPADGAEAEEPNKLLVGSCKGWLLDATEVGALEAGHPVSLTYLNSLESSSANASKNYLWRLQQAGQGAYNVMQTHLGIQSGASLQFLASGQTEVDPNDAKATRIEAKSIQLDDEAYWNKQTLQVCPGVSFEDGKLVFTGDYTSLEISADGISLSENYYPERGTFIKNKSITLADGQYNSGLSVWTPENLQFDHDDSTGTVKRQSKFSAQEVNLRVFDIAKTGVASEFQLLLYQNSTYLSLQSYPNDAVTSAVRADLGTSLYPEANDPQKKRRSYLWLVQNYQQATNENGFVWLSHRANVPHGWGEEAPFCLREDNGNLSTWPPS